MDGGRGVYLRLCIRYQDMPAELRLALGVTEVMNEALWLLTFPGDKRIVYPTPDRVALGPDWRGRCEGQASH